MKKTLAAVAVLGAFAGSALAADVTLYGRVDAGLIYQHNDQDLKGVDATDEWGIKDGASTGSRFGFKGSEQISEDLTVGFQLENGFDVDNGALGSSSKIFDREARLYVQTNFGEIGVGRYGRLASDAGGYSFRGNYIIGSSWGNFTGGSEVVFAKTSSRLDNMITYKSPSFGGVTIFAQYGMGENGVENESNTDRYAGIGALGKWGDLTASLIVEQNNWANTTHADDDGLSVEAGVAYNFGAVKLALTGQYFQDGVGVVELYDGQNDYFQDLLVDGYGVKVGAEAALLGGTLQGVAGYMDVESAESDVEADMTRYMVAATYKYPLSKRTYVYAAASYVQDDMDAKVDGDKPSNTEVMMGMAHYF